MIFIHKSQFFILKTKSFLRIEQKFYFILRLDFLPNDKHIEKSSLDFCENQLKIVFCVLKQIFFLLINRSLSNLNISLDSFENLTVDIFLTAHVVLDREAVILHIEQKSYVKIMILKHIT
jgi:hypothetical protein